MTARRFYYTGQRRMQRCQSSRSSSALPTTNLIRHWKASSATSSVWTDSVGGSVLVQPTGTNQPSISANRVVFDGVNDFYQGAKADWDLFHQGNGATIMICGSMPSVASAALFSSSTSGGHHGWFAAITAGGTTVETAITNGTTPVIYHTSSAVGFGGVVCLVWQYKYGRTGDDFEIFSNGVSRGSQNSLAVPSAVTSTFDPKLPSYNGSSNFYGWSLGEIAVWDDVIDLTNVWKYCRDTSQWHGGYY